MVHLSNMPYVSSQISCADDMPLSPLPFVQWPGHGHRQHARERGSCNQIKWRLCSPEKDRKGIRNGGIDNGSHGRSLPTHYQVNLLEIICIAALQL